MIPLAIEGTTRLIGKSQGYKGLCVADLKMEDGTPMMATAWEPTPSELAILNAGGTVRLFILGSAHPPVMIEVAP